MNKKLLATAAAASTLGGAVAGATFFAPGGAGAQEDTESPAPAESEVRPEVGERIAEALQGLVDDGTLTDAQVDAVVQALQDAQPEGFRGPRGHGGPRGFGADLGEILGLDSAEIREALVDGTSLADLAASQGVDSQDLVDAIVAATEERVNGAVEDERIDQEKADEILAGAEEKAEGIVNGEFDGRRGPRGRFGPNAPTPEADADA
ncbi:MAG: hypothetical protein DHS20C19_26300 [Acidimicrobiales bacterium]|nr:MAG: hypothetical protein DHS20C19_26300 [Acidimicrobiales bacterium]